MAKILDVLSALEANKSASTKSGVQLENMWTRGDFKKALQKHVQNEDFDRLVSYLIDLNILVDMGADLLLLSFLLKPEYDQKLVNIDLYERISEFFEQDLSVKSYFKTI